MTTVVVQESKPVATVFVVCCVVDTTWLLATQMTPQQNYVL